MRVSEELYCLFSATVEKRDGSYVLDVPDRELELGRIDEGGTYRVALLPASDGTGPKSEAAGEPATTGDESGSGTGRDTDPDPDPDPGRPDPPVEEGETRTVEIEDIGSQGDGITRVERGYVIIVPDTERSERVRIEVSDVQENVAFADVIERLSYYD
ncbi:TRAM domain-containing protein [Natronomonas sp.]|uniref:TRAM domain-containing protein n=1 Tax=Natronomonas sp. TaxID=2184060 RepID=UPI002621D8C6|nr:TRAM domain-containing protein [Natronomonas sp.]